MPEDTYSSSVWPNEWPTPKPTDVGHCGAAQFQLRRDFPECGSGPFLANSLPDPLCGVPLLARCLLVRLQDRVDKLLHRFQLRLPPHRRLALGTQECAETYVVGPARKESTAPLSPKCQVYFVDISLALYYFTLGIEQTRFTKPDEKYHSTRSFPGGA